LQEEKQKGRLGYEDGMATYTAEGDLTHYEYTHMKEALSGFVFINAHEIVDTLSIIKDQGTINRFRKASLIVDEGQKAARAALENSGFKGMTEAVIGGIGALAMRKAGSVSEWNFAGLNEISSGYRTGLEACTLSIYMSSLVFMKWTSGHRSSVNSSRQLLSAR
jgi:Xaa-Pro aminopeptidase